MSRYSPRSSWRRFLDVIGIVCVVAVLVLVSYGATKINWPWSEKTPASVASTTPQSASPSNTDNLGFTGDQKLVDAVYSFVEADQLPPSPRRNDLLKKLSTPDGYKMVYRNPADQSEADKAARNIVVSVIREESSMMVEQFEDTSNAISVHTNATIRITRDGKVVNTMRLPGQTTSWIKEGGVWRFAYVQS